MIILPIFIFFLAVIIHDVYFPRPKEYRFSSRKMKKPIRFALISDLHNFQFGKANSRLVKAILKEAPDAVLIAGDLLTAERHADEAPSMALLEGLRKEGLPVIMALGNHEQRMLEEWAEEDGDRRCEDFLSNARRLGVNILQNENMLLEEFGVNIIGLQFPMALYEKKFFQNSSLINSLSKEGLEKFVGKPDANAFNILIAHDPERFDTYDAWGPDLTLSGHMHGGVIRFPFLGGLISPSWEIFPKYSGGRYEGRNGTLIVSRGVGVHTLPVRVFNPSEIVVVELRKR